MFVWDLVNLLFQFIVKIRLDIGHPSSPSKRPFDTGIDILGKPGDVPLTI
jgi:hypothetical protein